MSRLEKITSAQNPRIKSLVRLRNRNARDERNLFAIEGERAIERAIEKGHSPQELYYSPNWIGDNAAAERIIETCERSGATLFEVGEIPFRKASYRERPEGLLAVLPQWKHELEELNTSNPPFLLIVESIEKPGNIGTLLRSADAAGVDAIICCDPITDLFNPNVVRSSTGTLFSMPVVMTETAIAIEWIRSQSIHTVATSPSATRLYTDCNLKGPIAIVMGSEKDGLSQEWLDACDERIRIPMAGQADSLNVAMASLIALFEAVRQRS